MKFRLYAGSKWEPTTARCRRDGGVISQEVKKDGARVEYYTCSRSGCSWPDYDENIRDIKNQIADNAKTTG